MPLSTSFAQLAKQASKQAPADSEQQATPAVKRRPPRETPLQRLWSRLQEEEKNLELEKAKAKDVWRMILTVQQKNEKARAALQPDGVFDFVDPTNHLSLNVGGQLFEVTAQVLCKDKTSALAALCRKDKSQLPLQPDANGTFFIDRDWWTFRHILHFLRDGFLPDDPPLLQEMFIDASYYHLHTLRKAIPDRITSDVDTTTSSQRAQFLNYLLESTTNYLSHRPPPPLADPYPETSTPYYSSGSPGYHARRSQPRSSYRRPSTQSDTSISSPPRTPRRAHRRGHQRDHSRPHHPPPSSPPSTDDLFEQYVRPPPHVRGHHVAYSDRQSLTSPAVPGDLKQPRSARARAQHRPSSAPLDSQHRRGTSQRPIGQIPSARSESRRKSVTRRRHTGIARTEERREERRVGVGFACDADAGASPPRPRLASRELPDPHGFVSPPEKRVQGRRGTLMDWGKR